MKAKRKLVLLLLPALYLNVCLEASENEDENGYLKLLPGSGDVLIDAETVEITEPVVLDLAAGAHTIKYLYEVVDLQWIPPFVTQPFDITRGDTLTIDLKETLSLNILSKPSDAQIHLRNRFLGTTPLSITFLVVPNQTLIFKKDRFQSKSVTITENLMDNPNLTVSLMPVAENSWIDEEEEVLAGQPSRQRRRLIKYSLAGLTVGAAIAGLTFKEQADDAFAAYQTSANQERIQFFFDRAESRDNMARAAFLVSEAALFVTVYLFIKDQRKSNTHQVSPIEISLDPTDRRRLKLAYKFRY